jgi:hypothetical protein
VKKNTPIKLWEMILPIAIVAIMCGLICLLSWQWFVNGCMWWECVNSEHFDPQEIQIPREYFPDQAVYGNLGTDINSEGAKQRDAQTVWWNTDSRIILEVARFPGTSRAKKEFAFDIRNSKQLFDIPSGQSSGLTYQSASANQMFVGCGKLAPWGINCIFAARYDEDLITLTMSIDEQMTPEDFERIIIYLDTVAARRLGH